ncbi:MAG: hypothetical protein ACE363_13190 [Alphaproteobacteria bacterium]
MPESDTSIAPGSHIAMGRWATLGDAARILDMQPEKLLKQLKRGKRRGTQIGNNWFAYVDAEAEEAAIALQIPVSDRHAQAIEDLQQQNSELREALARLEEAPAADTEVPEQPATPAAPAIDLAPLVDRIADLHRSSAAEIEFLRGELKSVREQHAEEMRRKDILLQQAHKSLQQAVRANPPRAALTQQTATPEVDRLRRERAQTHKLLREMSSVMALMYRRMKKD